MSKDRPRPTLADDLIFLSKPLLVEPKIHQKIVELARGAKKFVLTEDAARKVAEAIQRYPEMLVEQGVFARTPFETCWIEFPSIPLHEVFDPNSIGPSNDTRVGYLFHGDHVYVVAQNEMEGPVPAVNPIAYHLHHPLTLRQQVDLASTFGISRMQLDPLLWGVTANNLDLATLRGLRDQHAVKLIIRNEHRPNMAGFPDLASTFSGELRNILGILLMINQPSGVLRTDDVERRRTTTHKGNRVLMSHSVITINLDGRSRPDRLLRPPHSTHASPRWHEVMDHWCNDRLARSRGHSLDDPKTLGHGDHAHDWEQGTGLRFTCRVCGGRRWRRKMKGRGDKSRGMISQERIIKSG